MKDKLLLAFKNKYANLGLDAKILEGLATQFEATTTDETIDNVVNGVEPLLKTFQGQADKRVADAIAKAKLEATKPPKQENQNPPKEESKSDDTPEWVKALQGTIQGMASEIQALKGNKVLTDRNSILEAELKDANPTFKASIMKILPKIPFESDEAFQEFVAETKADSAAYVQDVANQGLSGISRPNIPTNLPATDAIDRDIKAWSDKDKATK